VKTENDIRSRTNRQSGSLNGDRRQSPHLHNVMKT
jgi:hypothetical protein